MKRWWAYLPLGALLVIFIVAFSLLAAPKPAPASFISPLRPAPQFDVPGLDAAQVKLSDYKGRPVLVNFWATWCGPCKLEHPLLVEMQKQGVEIVGVLYKDPTGLDAARELLATEGNPFAVVGLDPTGDLGIDMGLSGVPESFLIDANGQIIKQKRNYFVEQDVVDFIAAYRAEQAKSGKAPAGG
jgi:cytochrome c biogenesis protein CcmG, thiol:disulfide interchange protein DsbE